MDDCRFDSLVRALAQGKSRRSVLKGMLGLGGAALAGSVLQEGDSEAAKRPAPTPTPVKCPGSQTLVGGVCTCPPNAPSKCGPACCNPAGVGAAHSECCDNACCHGQCYGEERCCPTGRVVCEGGCLPEGQCCNDSDCPHIDACTTNICRDRICVQTPVICDDGNICTTNTCDPVQGCVFEAISCDDHNACTTEHCDPEVGCVYTAINCDDGNACTIDSCDPAYGCIHTIVNCDDGNACTVDSCDPTRGCVYTAVNCDDGNSCTIDSCDPELGCVYKLVDCSGLDDPERCLVGVCNDGTCSAVATCSQDETCNGDGTCGVAQTCVGESGLCQHNVDCCEGCCIANLPNFDDWVAVCIQAGIIPGPAAFTCAQAILDQGYPLTCRNPPVVTFNLFPGNPVPLPCTGS